MEYIIASTTSSHAVMSSTERKEVEEGCVVTVTATCLLTDRAAFRVDGLAQKLIAKIHTFVNAIKPDDENDIAVKLFVAQITSEAECLKKESFGVEVRAQAAQPSRLC